MCFVTKSAPHLELHWDHLLSPQKWRVMSLVSLTQHPKELLSLLIQVCRGRESKPKIRAVFTAKAPPENCWFLPFSSPLKHQALAHCQLTASSEEVPLNSFGCFQIWSDHIMSLDRIIWMKKNSLRRSECTKFPLAFSGLLNYQHAALHFICTCGHRLVLGTEHCKGEWQRAGKKIIFSHYFIVMLRWGIF